MIAFKFKIFAIILLQLTVIFVARFIFQPKLWGKQEIIRVKLYEKDIYVLRNKGCLDDFEAELFLKFCLEPSIGFGRIAFKFFWIGLFMSIFGLTVFTIDRIKDSDPSQKTCGLYGSLVLCFLLCSYFYLTPPLLLKKGFIRTELKERYGVVHKDGQLDSGEKAESKNENAGP